jgi:hypothetical protein
MIRTARHPSAKQARPSAKRRAVVLIDDLLQPVDILAIDMDALKYRQR